MVWVWRIAVPLAWGLVALAWHAAWLAADQTLPSGDAPGHLLNVTRHHAWLYEGAGTPMQPFLPGVYLPAAALVQVLGPSMDATRLAVAGFSAFGVAGLSALGLFLQGRTAALLLPLLWLAAPSATNYSRLLLMDVPAAALMPWILLTLWGSDGFRRLVPTLLFGLFLGWAVLNKLTIALFLLVPLAVAGLVLVVRSPLALVPLVLAVVPLVRGFQGAWARKDLAAAMYTGPDFAGVKLTLGWLGGALALTLVLWAVLRRRDSLRRGLALAGAAQVSGLVVIPWLHAMAPSVYEKLYREGVAEVIVTDPERVLAWNIEQLLVVVPHTWWWGQGVFWLLVLVPLGLRWERLSGLLGPVKPWVGWRLWELAASAALGTWLISRTLPINARYVLPAALLLAVVWVVAVCRVRPTRWVLAPVLAVFAAGQLGSERLPAAWSIALQEPVDQQVRAGAVRGHQLLVAGPPREGMEQGLESAAAALVDLPGIGGQCRQVGFSLGPGLKLEPRTVVAMGTLWPLKECAWVSLRDQGARGLEDPKAVVVLGATQGSAERTAASVASQVGLQARWIETDATASGPWLFALEAP